MTWTVSTSAQPPLHTVTPWSLSSEAALPESLSSHLSFLPSVSAPLMTIFQSPRTSRSTEHSFLHQPCLMQLHVCASSFHQLSCQYPELPRTSIFSSFIRLRQKSQPWVSLMISFLQDFTLQVKKWRKSPARKWSPLLIRGPYEALPSDPATPGWSLTTLNSLNLEPMRCLSVSHLIFMW